MRSDLARAARAPRAGHQPRRHPDHALAASDQEPLKRARDVPAVLQRPHPIAAETARPLQHLVKAAHADADRLIAEHLAGRRGDPGDRVRALVHVRTEHDHQLSPLLLAVEVDGRRTRLAGGAATLLSSHAGHPRPATSDTTKGSQARRADSLKESQLAAGRDLLLSAGHHRRGNHNSKPQSASGCRRSRSAARQGYRSCCASLSRSSCACVGSLSGIGSACRCITRHSPSSRRKTVVTRSSYAFAGASPTAAVVCSIPAM